MPVTERVYSITADGHPVKEFTFTNRHGYEARILEYGCALTHFLVPTSRGKVDVVLGYDSLADYERGSASHGAVVGRYANRIEASRFTIDGKDYYLPPNEGPHHLHGPLSHTLFHGESWGEVVVLRAVSPAGEDGFPGNLEVTVTYTLTAADALIMDFRASTDAPTHVNLTNHTYWNLAGAGSGDVLGHTMVLGSSAFLECNAATLPTGAILPVVGTPFDFRTAAPLSQGLPPNHPQLKLTGGYDHCFLLEEGAPFAAKVHSPQSGITLELATTQPALQLYTGNHLAEDPVPGKGGVRYPKWGGFALETQHYPCSPSHPSFPSTLLRPGETYHEVAAYHLISDRPISEP
ncbi:MAG: galactose mutarotase [Oscillospiraceae bacterium]|nr:galactose mutarotase [Oscillospiraceae bacterium]